MRVEGEVRLWLEDGVGFVSRRLKTLTHETRAMQRKTMESPGAVQIVENRDLVRTVSVSLSCYRQARYWLERYPLRPQSFLQALETRGNAACPALFTVSTVGYLRGLGLPVGGALDLYRSGGVVSTVSGADYGMPLCLASRILVLDHL